ncbi:DNA-binding protein WhiA [Ruminococcus flavefaciens]|uniref:DNA-binding protein WhiA n=1 Tax=Ruminococcus flavefaciens TaxID=1265 RepID=UPI0026ED88EE|nr:DNA-binding protein WhiA [Ruminococcus flavefaciens]
MCSSVNDKDRRFACLYGMLLFCRTLTRQHICFQSESRISAELFCSLFSAVFHKKLSIEEHVRKNGVVLCSCDTDSETAEAVFQKYHLADDARAIDSEIIATNSLGVFTAGVFLACGSVNDPNKEYHLEFACPEEKLAEQLATLLGDIGVTAKTVLRRGQNIVYIKGSESIEDTLTFIGASQCTLELMNTKIYKDIRNKANRIANCDAANIDKVVKAAMKQIDDIKLIDKAVGLDTLSEELREVAQIRIENIDMSLQEIGENLSEPISRSGVNHRFQKLAKMADEIRRVGGCNEK